jgi:hypothetical protein
MPSAVSSIRSIGANSRSTPKIVQICFLEPDNPDTFVSSPLGGNDSLATGTALEAL